MVFVDSAFVEEILGLVLAPAIVGPVVGRAATRWAKRAGASPAKVRGLGIAVTAVWVAVLAAGLSITLAPRSLLSTLTASAIAGIAITLALQTTLQNLVSGVILLQHRFLRVGDSVQFSGTKGTVVGFGLVTTVIKATDGTLVFVSNSNLLSGPLVNATAAARLAGEY